MTAPVTANTPIHVSMIAIPEASASVMFGISDLFNAFPQMQGIIPGLPEVTPFQVEVLGEAKTAGLCQSDPFVLRRFLTGALSWTTTWFRPGGKMSLDELAEQALALVIKEG